MIDQRLGAVANVKSCAVTGNTVQLLYWPEATQSEAGAEHNYPVTVSPIPCFRGPACFPICSLSTDQHARHGPHKPNLLRIIQIRLRIRRLQGCRSHPLRYHRPYPKHRATLLRLRGNAPLRRALPTRLHSGIHGHSLLQHHRLARASPVLDLFQPAVMRNVSIRARLQRRVSHH
jgi:hypothetical protein